MAERKVVVADILDEEVEISLGELCRMCSIHAEFVIEMVDEGMLEPRGHKPDHWRFPGTAVPRAQTAVRLQRDLGVNLPGIALALDLLDEVNELKATVRALERRIQES